MEKLAESQKNRMHEVAKNTAAFIGSAAIMGVILFPLGGLEAIAECRADQIPTATSHDDLIHGGRIADFIAAKFCGVDRLPPIPSPSTGSTIGI